jgi:cation:H+ antiporter
MTIVIPILGLLFGLVILLYSSELAVDKMISIAQIFGLSMFMIGFIVSSIGSDLPEIFNSIMSAYLGHGGISVGDSLGSILTQITLVLGIIPFFCSFCRLIPSTFFLVGLTEVILVAISVVISLDGNITRLDGLLLILLWGISILILRRFEEEKIIVEDSVLLSKPDKKLSRLIGLTILGFIGIGIGSYIVIRSIIQISRLFNVSEYIVSFFILSIGTSMPELIISISAIRKRHFELAVGDIIGSCIVDATLGIGLGPFFFPIYFDSSALLYTGVYAVIASLIVVSVLSYKRVNDKTSGGFFLIIYAFAWILPLLLL